MFEFIFWITYIFKYLRFCYFIDMANSNCPKCHGKGFFKKPDGSVTTCFDCLMAGDMDQHDENVKESGIKV